MNKSILKHVLALSPHLLMVFIYCLNFRWLLSDNDDGHTLGYSALGSNEWIQRSYGAYDSMCEYLLGLLPINYYVLLGVMVFVSFLSSLSLIFIIRKLLTKFLAIEPVYADLGILIFLFGMPDFLYMLFSFKSAIISFNIILIGFYLLLNFTENKKNIYFISSILLFGLGVSLRWSNLLYGIPISAVLFYISHQSYTIRKSFIIIILWGAAALLSSVLFIYISGYTPQDIIETYLWGKNYLEKTDFQFIARIGDLSLLLTPLSFLFFITACYALFLERSKNSLTIVWVITSILPTFVIGFAPSLKFLISWWPVFIYMFAYSIQFISNHTSGIKNFYWMTSFVFIGINWFIGVQINTPLSSWGPGLEIKNNLEGNSSFNKKMRIDDRFKFENINIGFYDGLALPTAEGIRPLYGHAYALFGGKLLALDKKLNSETDDIVKRAAVSHSTIYQDRINPYLLASYLRFGYITKQPWKQKGDFSKRTFSNRTNSFTELRINSPQNIFDIELLNKNTKPTDTLYLAFTYTSALNKFLYIWDTKYHYPYEKIGPFTAKIYRNEETD